MIETFSERKEEKKYKSLFGDDWICYINNMVQYNS